MGYASGLEKPMGKQNTSDQQPSIQTAVGAGQFGKDSTLLISFFSCFPMK